ncbi:MAG: terminase large subunit domain-containing protein, partial [Armatimonadota bacterium]
SRLISDAVERLLLGSELTRKLTRTLKTPYPRITIGRSVIMARTADEDGRNLRGHAADRVIVDEAAYVRDSVVQEVITPMLADRCGQLVMISTPFGKNHFYHAFIRGQGSGGNGEPGLWSVKSFRYPSWLNPHISRDYIEAQQSQISPRQFAVEYEAQFLDDQASVFAWDDIEAAASHPASDPRTNPHYECVVAGIDWARYSDYTALVALGVGDSRLAVIGIDRFNGIGWHAQIERAADFLRRHRTTAVLTDQTSIGDPLLEQLRSRLGEMQMDVRVEGLTFTSQSKRELIDSLAIHFAHRTISIPRDERLMRELQYFEYELTGSGGVRMQARPGYHDDLVLALALACRQARGLWSGGGCLVGSGSRVSADGW